MIFRSRPPYIQWSDLLLAICLIVLLLLFGCAPTLNTIAGDEAELMYVTNPQEGPCAPAPGTGLCFDPGEEVAKDINVNVLASTIIAISDFCTPSENGYNCFIAFTSEPVFVAVDAEDVTASVRYRRLGSNQWYLEFAD